MKQESILLIGAGGHARACIDVIQLEGRFSVAGLVGLPHEVGERICDYSVLCSENELPKMIEQYAYALITVGQIKTPDARIRLFDWVVQAGCALPVIVSPRAYVSPHATLGAGTVVMHGAIVNAGVAIGRNCIVNSQALIEHDAVIADHCHIATAAVINGGVNVGVGSFVGSNACVRQGVKIAERCVIGMGQCVVADCDAGTQMPSLKNKF